MNAFPINLFGAGAATDTGGISANPLGQPMAASTSPYSAVASELVLPMTTEFAPVDVISQEGDAELLLVEAEASAKFDLPVSMADSEELPELEPDLAQAPVVTRPELADTVTAAVVPATGLLLSGHSEVGDDLPVTRLATAPLVTAAPASEATVATSSHPAALLAPADKAGMTLAAPPGVTTAMAATAVPVTVIPEQLEARAQLAAAHSKTVPAAVMDAGGVSVVTTQSAVSVWGPMTVPKAGDQASLAREMLAPLGDQIRFNLEQGIKRAEVRLDPPDLGRIELTIRQEGDRISVQLQAANPQVREALANGAERLRQEMMQQFDGQVDVDVGQHQPEQQQHSQSWDERILAAEHQEMSRSEDEHDIIDMLA
ncbi:hook-length control protein FliK [Ferrimonas sediminum]|uniref:Hook-length control protein FliK n=1 Tax=Ferrimonas sediminum TaxID=718193 RepID=A0A1G8ZZ37_9GAMM|nr:flagellar hook-length control protein FliK [Ferrimonas sediminum]SDK20368.1 hook-length control protein FliK [Ferrimonas sediminum]